jgi:pyruvate/2-oxoglutarate dehydrogenase complex dihydrolipoamide acyltransferase (E2) component
MATSIHVPRVNNNDDEVKLISLRVAAGDAIRRGQVVAEVETDKAVVEVESSADGFVLGVLANVEDVVAVGSVLFWAGERADEPMPVAAAANERQTTSGEPTAKARQLLRQHGLEASAVPASGDRLTVDDIQSFLANRGKPGPAAVPRRAAETSPDVAGELRDLRSEERGMIATVTWHRDVAVAGYIELEYDPAPWEAYAKTFAERHNLLLSPLLSLMCWRLVQLAMETPKLNATIVGNQRYEYSAVNCGFTVQAGDTLYLAVTRDAQRLDEAGFVNAMGELQRRAAAHKLGPMEIQGTTISFSSMARWKVSRHIPVLPPQTAIMVAHAISLDGRSVLGASYDHRVLNGSHVVSALRKLSKPNPSA